MSYTYIHHPIPPLFDSHSKLLILGSFPSVKSRESSFFYGHPQNRFWKVLSAVFEQPLPETVAEKKAFLLASQIALWDVIGQCDIVGSSDSSIKNVQPNDLSVILSAADIGRIYLNGKTAERCYNRYIRETMKREAICLPSTSPANAAWSLERLIEAWRVVRYSE